MRLLFIKLFIVLSFTSYSQVGVLECEVYGMCYNQSPCWINTGFSMDGGVVEYNGCGDPISYPSIHVAVLRPGTCDFWENCSGGVNPQYYFGNQNDCFSCRQRTERYFIFRIDDSLQMQSLNNFLNLDIPGGNYILLYSYMYVDFNLINTNYPYLTNTLTNLGFNNVTSHADTIPFIFFTQKGIAGSSIEIYGDSLETDLYFATPVQICQPSTTGFSNENQSDLKLFPTLLQNGQNLQVDFDEIEIYTLLGQKVFGSSLPGNSIQIDNLDAGMYLVKAKKSDMETTQKIQVVR